MGLFRGEHLVDAIHDGITTFTGAVVFAVQASYQAFSGAILSVVQATIGGSTQIIVQNTSSDNAASSDHIANADNATATTNYVDLGINSSTYNQAAYNSGGANDGYVYCSNGNFNVATAAAGKTVTINAGGTTTANTVATFGSSATTLGSNGSIVSITGVTSGVLASPGIVGQVIQSQVPVGSAVALTTATPANMTSITLSAGDWDIEGTVNFNASSATTVVGNLWEAGLNTTSATLPVDGTQAYLAAPVSTTTSFIASIPVTSKLYSINTGFTVYLVAEATFSAGTVGAFGSIIARRRR